MLVLYIDYIVYKFRDAYKPSLIVLPIFSLISFRPLFDMVRDAVSITICNNPVGKIVEKRSVILISRNLFVIMHSSKNDLVHKTDGIQNGIKNLV